MGEDDKCEVEAPVVCGTDSKYAWFAIIPSVFATAFAVMGVQYSAGVMTSAFIDAFEESITETSWVTAVAIGCLMLAMGPAGYLQGMIGNRMLVILGGAMASLGLLLSSWTTEIWQIFLSFSLLTGVGQGFAYLGAVSMVNGSWFSPGKRAMAMALASSGSGFGTAALGPLTQYLDDNESWHFSMRILALVTFVLICGGGLLMKPEPSTANAPKKDVDTSLIECFHHCKFLYFLLTLFILGIGICNSQVHNVEYVIVHGFSQTESTNYNLFGFAVGSVFGRPIAAEVTGKIGKRVGYPIIMGILALFTGVMPYMADEGWKIVFNNVCFGWAFGAWISILPSMTAEIIGMELFGQALGLVYAAPGLTMMVGPPICGYIKEAEGDYDNSYYYSAAMMGLAGLMSIPMIFWESALAPKPPPLEVSHDQTTNHENVVPAKATVKSDPSSNEDVENDAVPRL